MGKCLSANLSGHRHLFREQLKSSRGRKGCFILDANKAQQILATQPMSYSDIAAGKRFHSERLHPQMKAQKHLYLKALDTAASVSSGNADPPLPVLSDCYHKNRTNSLSFSYSPQFAAAIGDCQKGYRTVDQAALLSLRSRYSRLFFIYLSGKSDSFTFREDTLREMFFIEGQYKHFSALKKRLECVKREFERLGVKFLYEFRGNRKHRELFVHAQGMEKYHPSFQQKKEEGIQERSKKLSEAMVKFLKEEAKLNDVGINSNRQTFLGYIYFFGEKGLMDFLSKKMKSKGYWKAQNRIGYLIEAVRRETALEKETGRVEEKKTDVDSLQMTDPLVRDIYRQARDNLVKKFSVNSS
jgi:hypothetical protein